MWEKTVSVLTPTTWAFEAANFARSALNADNSFCQTGVKSRA